MNIDRSIMQSILAAAEFGFKSHETGWSLQKMLDEAKEIFMEAKDEADFVFGTYQKRSNSNSSKGFPMKKPLRPNEVDSCDEIRKAMIVRRNDAIKTWPEGINDTVLFSHVIAWLGYCESLEQWVSEQANKKEQH